MIGDIIVTFVVLLTGVLGWFLYKKIWGIK